MVANYQILTNTIQNRYSKHKSEFYIAKNLLENYTKPIALLGTRRTGKTVTLQQLFTTIAGVSKQYIRFTKDATKEDLLDLVASQLILENNYLFIDEITNIPALDEYLGDFLDGIECLPCKIIMAGTNSLLLTEAIPNSASGRLDVVNYNPPNYEDYKNILGSSFHDFMMGNISFYNGPEYIKDLSRDIYNAMDLIADSNFSSLDISEYEIYKTLEIIIEQVMNKSTGLHRNKLLFRKTLYTVKINTQIYDHIISKEHFEIIIRALLKMKLFTLMINEDMLDEEEKSMSVYLTTPVLLKGLLNKYDKIPLATKEGDIFESIAATQIMTKLSNTTMRFCKLRESLGNYEIDFVIIDEISKNIFFMDFKRSSSKEINISNDVKKAVEDFYKSFKCNYNYFTVYLVDKDGKDYIGSNKFQIDYFLKNLTDILK